MKMTPGIQLPDVELVSLTLGNAPNTDETSTNMQNLETSRTLELKNMDGTENAENTDGFENTERNGRNGTEADSLNIAALNASQMDTAQDAKLPTPAKKNAGFGFLDYLKSPIVEVSVGQGDDETVLTAHQSLLLESPFLAETVSKFDESGSRFIKLPDEDVDAFGCFLQFLYTRDYAFKQAEGQVDDSGEQLLKHARVHTLAGKLGIPELKTIAHSKIHRVRSSPRGELEYARYVYTHTTTDDAALRKPIASFWANRSHELRHGIEEEFKSLCLEAPEFSYDVLILVLENKRKRSQEKTDGIEVDSGSRPSGRKRQRRAANRR